MNMTDTAGRDRLYFQRQRALLATVHNAWADATAASDELRSRLEDLDELAEAIAFEVTDSGVQHRYSGQPVPWMQQRIGDHVKAVRIAAERLRLAADDLHDSANDAGGMPRLAHVAIGHRALVAEAVRVVASHRPDRELEQVDWKRVDAVVAGIERLEERDAAELREELEADLRDHDQRLADLRASGLDKLAERIDRDPRLQRALATMREFVGA
ncbi:hypothetical protein SAMN05428982_1926 [Pseudoxanthomonas sp. CF385]|uniref:hypothetical protein n=1 Tax=Pseudoxanthomonas sp. CF385 TaxID=1881042 RepID=UPI00088F46E8|nr:hypothetical protein [Pseudoxanthomonas sp. CF385]SDQ64054.1 hypothetical protein SAMN05428982_1926 [Pseudoxanthomonas sp. CF385]